MGAAALWPSMCADAAGLAQHAAENDAALHFDDVAPGTHHWNAYRRVPFSTFAVRCRLHCHAPARLAQQWGQELHAAGGSGCTSRKQLRPAASVRQQMCQCCRLFALMQAVICQARWPEAVHKLKAHARPAQAGGSQLV